MQNYATVTPCKAVQSDFGERRSVTLKEGEASSVNDQCCRMQTECLKAASSHAWQWVAIAQMMAKKYRHKKNQVGIRNIQQQQKQ